MKVRDVRQVEATILELQAEDPTELLAWLREHCAGARDKQIARG